MVAIRPRDPSPFQQQVENHCNLRKRWSADPGNSSDVDFVQNSIKPYGRKGRGREEGGRKKK